MISYYFGHFSVICRTLDHYKFNSGIFYLSCQFLVYRLILLSQDLSCIRIYDVFSHCIADKSVEKPQFFVVFISSDLSQIITLRIEEHRIEQRLRTFKRRRFARSQFLIYLLETFLIIRGRILFQRFQQSWLFTESIQDLLIASHSHRSEKGRHRLLSRPVDSDRDYFIGVSFIFEPCPPVRDDCCEKQVLT